MMLWGEKYRLARASTEFEVRTGDRSRFEAIILCFKDDRIGIQNRVMVHLSTRLRMVRDGRPGGSATLPR